MFRWTRMVKLSVEKILRRCVRRGLISIVFLSFVCFCILLHHQSLPHKQPLSIHVQELLDCTWQEAGHSLLKSTARLWAPFLAFATAFGGFIVDAARLVFLWVKFVYPFFIPLASAAAHLYIRSSVPQRLAGGGVFGILLLLYVLRRSGILQELRQRWRSFYTAATQWVILSAPLGLMVLLHVSLCLIFGSHRVVQVASSLWLAVPAAGSAVFVLQNISLRKQTVCTSADSDKSLRGIAVHDQEQRLEALLRSFRSLTFWLLLWTSLRLLDIASWIIRILPLPLTIYDSASTLHLHAFSCLSILIVITGGPSSLLIFVQGQRCIRAVAVGINWITASTLGIVLLLPSSQDGARKAQRVERFLANQKLAVHSRPGLQVTTTEKYQKHQRHHRGLKPTWQLARVFGFRENEIYALHCLSDFDPLELVLDSKIQNTLAEGSVLKKLRSAATSAVSFISKSKSEEKLQSPGSQQSPDAASGLATLFLSKFAPLQHVAAWFGVRLSQKLTFLITPAIQYSPELLLFFLPSFLLRPLLVFLLLGLPFLGSVACLERNGALSERIFWLLYYSGASVTYAVHCAFEEDGVLQLLFPFPLTRLLLALWALQTTAKAFSTRAVLDPRAALEEDDASRVPPPASTATESATERRVLSSRPSASRPTASQERGDFDEERAPLSAAEAGRPFSSRTENEAGEEGVACRGARADRQHPSKECRSSDSRQSSQSLSSGAFVGSADKE